jgi:hypothetical protein
MKQLHRQFLLRLIILAMITFALGFAAGLEAGARNAETIREARIR